MVKPAIIMGPCPLLSPKMPANAYRITLTSFLAYFMMSSVISPIGIVTAPIARHYGLSLTTATASFSYLTAGVLAGTLAALVIFDWLRIKPIVISSAGLLSAALLAIYVVDRHAWFPLWLFLAGLACGVALAAALVVITQVYAIKLRPSMMLLTDSFYSMAGFVSTFLAGMFLAARLHWGYAYLLAFSVSLLVVLVAAFSDYPATGKRDAPRATATAEGHWPLETYLLAGAIVMYLTGIVTLYSWMPNYAREQFDLGPDLASRLVSRLFLGMFLGQLLMFWLALRYSLVNIICAACTLSTLLTVSLWFMDTAFRLNLSMFILGLVTGGMLKLIIAFGTMLVEKPSPRMISFLLFCSAVGTALAPAVSSLVVARHDMAAVLRFSSLCYCAMCVLVFVSICLSHRRKKGRASDAPLESSGQ